MPATIAGDSVFLVIHLSKPSARPITERHDYRTTFAALHPEIPLSSFVGIVGHVTAASSSLGGGLIVLNNADDDSGDGQGDTERQYCYHHMAHPTSLISRASASTPPRPAQLACLRFGLAIAALAFFAVNGRLGSNGGATSRAGGPTRKDQRTDNKDDAKSAQECLGFGPPNGAFGCLSHAPLFAQIGCIVIFGMITTYFVIAGIGGLLLGDDRGWRNSQRDAYRWSGGPWGDRRRGVYALLFLGLGGWGGIIALSVAFDG